MCQHFVSSDAVDRVKQSKQTTRCRHHTACIQTTVCQYAPASCWRRYYTASCTLKLRGDHVLLVLLLRKLKNTLFIIQKMQNNL